MRPNPLIPILIDMMKFWMYVNDTVRKSEKAGAAVLDNQRTEADRPIRWLPTPVVCLVAMDGHHSYSTTVE